MNSKSPLVSVVVATYNMAQYLPDAIRSALAQHYSPLEIIVVDDGSTDDTASVMRQFAVDDRVRYLRQPNGGQARAKNRAIYESSGDFIAFLDADDLWAQDKLAVQVPLFMSLPRVGVVYTDFVCIDPAGIPLPTVRPKRYYSGKISGRLLVDNFVTGMTSLVRRECVTTLGAFDETLPMGVDYDLWLRLSTRYEFQYLDRITYLYRQWPGQMSHNQETRFRCALRIMHRFLDRNPGLVDPPTIREAWAHTYVGGAGIYRVSVKNAPRALGLYLRALQQRPTYLPAWKGIIKLALPGLTRSGGT